MTNFAFILESIGTPELILVLLVALIVFGPRKLPSLGRTFGKYMTEFKRASSDFRQTWEREVDAAEFEEKSPKSSGVLAENSNAVENTIGRKSPRRAAADADDFAAINENSIALPEIRAASEADFTINPFAAEPPAEAVSSAPEPEFIDSASRKREWL